MANKKVRITAGVMIQGNSVFPGTDNEPTIVEVDSKDAKIILSNKQGVLVDLSTKPTFELKKPESESDDLDAIFGPEDEEEEEDE
ncbi:hypothetical protein F0267_26140 [Vibrio coralliilyticus]|uniref:Uncharacterized protein n=1 Tax=Vibrio coralliilyticus TaxID=190893 RepID=A0AAN0VYZ5_9VIBR|nr:hypothetical protein [Vibrio coralliilyticus]AIW21348.1 hypothetical protein IX92_20270 [Vibrio coralliilyticus]NOH41711.1 hypothetical protein [Vibrio coralliilyticus]